MQDLDQQLDALFGEAALPDDPTGALRTVYDALADYSPSVLWITNTAGELLLVHKAKSQLTDDRIRTLAKEFAPRLGEQSVELFPCDEGIRMGFALAFDGVDGSRRLLGGLLRPADDLADRLHAFAPLLSCCAELVLRIGEFHQSAEELRIRLRHLQSEQDTLKTTYTRTITATIEEHERRIEHQTAFLANMSHEIRTPMTAILGFADNLLNTNMPESERLGTIHTIRRNGEHLLQVINDILDLSKVEAGKMEVQRVPCSPFWILSETASMMRVRAQAKNLALEMEFMGPIPETIRTDPMRLRQILLNLVSNAIKFTDSGGVRVITRVCRRQDSLQQATPRTDEPETYLQFDVIDTGIGIEESSIAEMFKPFTQADSTITRRFGGTGLGLAISQRFAHLLGGSISVESRPGEGSTFRLIIDPGPLDGVHMIENPTQAALIVPEQRPLSTDGIRLDCRVLLAEDGPDNQRLITFILTKAGAEVAVAANGQIAVEMALAAFEQEQPYDVILMDMQMPVLDGYEASSLLRSKKYTGPIIALTAHAMATDRQKCLDAGCDDYTTKPILRKELLEKIAAYATVKPAVPAGV